MRSLERSGDDSEMDTPVPIPNTEVKHFYGKDSYACHSEISKLPGFFIFQRFMLDFFSFVG